MRCYQAARFSSSPQWSVLHQHNVSAIHEERVGPDYAQYQKLHHQHRPSEQQHGEEFQITQVRCLSLSYFVCTTLIAKKVERAKNVKKNRMQWSTYRYWLTLNWMLEKDIWSSSDELHCSSNFVLNLMPATCLTKIGDKMLAKLWNAHMLTCLDRSIGIKGTNS